MRGATVTSPPLALLVGGGKGGVGKSSVAAGIARGLADSGLVVGMLDADLSGPSQAHLFECHTPMGVQDGRVVPARSAEGIRVASTALLARDTSALVWSEATAGSGLRLLAAPATWQDVDVLVVDLPPGHGAIAVEVANRFAGAFGVLVTTGSALALEECVRGATFFQRMEAPLLGMVENMAGVRCATCGTHTAVFPGDRAASVAAGLGIVVLAHVPLGAAVEHGDGLGRVCAAVLERLDGPGVPRPGTR